MRWNSAASGGLAGGGIGILVGLFLIQDSEPATFIIPSIAGLAFLGALAGAVMTGLDRIARALEDRSAPGTPETGVTKRSPVEVDSLQARYAPPRSSTVPAPGSGEQWPG